jgi:hypothetical protein
VTYLCIGVCMSAPFDTRYVASLLGTGILRVNKLAAHCDMVPTTKAGTARGRGKNRRYSVEDICRVALGYWLFRAGLRGPFIASILSDERVGRFFAQLDSVKRIRAEAVRHRFLLAWGFKTTRKKKKWRVEQEGVAFVGNLRRTPIVVTNQSCIIVPVGRLLQKLTDRMLG